MQVEVFGRYSNQILEKLIEVRSYHSWTHYTLLTDFNRTRINPDSLYMYISKGNLLLKKCWRKVWPIELNTYTLPITQPNVVSNVAHYVRYSRRKKKPISNGMKRLYIPFFFYCVVIYSYVLPLLCMTLSMAYCMEYNLKFSKHCQKSQSLSHLKQSALNHFSFTRFYTYVQYCLFCCWNSSSSFINNVPSLSWPILQPPWRLLWSKFIRFKSCFYFLW